MNLVEVQNVTKHYSSQLALDDVSLSIKQGRIFGLLGPNGAGKTTLIRILNHITVPDSGQVLLNGHPLQGDDVEKIGYLPEERGLYKKMKVGEQAVYLARLKGVDKKVAMERLRHWFRKFDIESWWNRNVEELSKGMQQKIQFVVTLIHQPELLIFDEPFSGLDPVNTNLLKKEVLELKRNGATIILSTHNMTSVEEICDDIALINHSKKILDGSVYEIRQSFKKNLFRLEVTNLKEDFQQSMNQAITLLEKNVLDNSTELVLKLNDGFSKNNLLSFFMDCSDIQSFNEILPSMNDIFIESVK